jgi:hypothetical protein
MSSLPYLCQTTVCVVDLPRALLFVLQARVEQVKMHVAYHCFIMCCLIISLLAYLCDTTICVVDVLHGLQVRV